MGSTIPGRSWGQLGGPRCSPVVPKGQRPQPSSHKGIPGVRTGEPGWLIRERGGAGAEGFPGVKQLPPALPAPGADQALPAPLLPAQGSLGSTGLSVPLEKWPYMVRMGSVTEPSPAQLPQGEPRAAGPHC